MPAEQVHMYQVVIRTSQGIQAFDATSTKNIDNYQAALLSGLNGIVTPYTRPGESIRVTEQNLVSITEDTGGVVQEPAQVSNGEQEAARVREILGDEE